MQSSFPPLNSTVLPDDESLMSTSISLSSPLFIGINNSLLKDSVNMRSLLSLTVIPHQTGQGDIKPRTRGISRVGDSAQSYFGAGNDRLAEPHSIMSYFIVRVQVPVTVTGQY